MKTMYVCALLALAAPVLLLATPPAFVVPELDPASASSVIAVLTGSGFMLRDRLRRR